MPGIEHDTLSDIQEIRRLLDGYEEGFAFIKELIQNADDAQSSRGKATALRLDWHPGLGEELGRHPLLAGPALVVTNDGPFEKEHRDGLMRMGLGSKAADPDRIGRFGLGMKAVFHVCEGFFFLEKSNDPDLREFFCPWHPDYRKEWDLDAGGVGWHELHQVVSALAAPEWQTWFAVWIPLRRKEHCEEVAPIRGGALAFPGDSTDTSPDFLRRPFFHAAPRLAETLIFLRNVDTVNLWDGEAETSVLHDREQRVHARGGRYFRYDVPGRQDEADTWRAKPAWPRVFELGEGFAGTQVPDKARWEASVAVSVNRDEISRGLLRIFWCVFLPVGNKPIEEIAVAGLEVDLHLFLHGYFFLNDARTHVYGVEDGFEGADEQHERGIRVAWNQALATSEHGLLPLVIPALSECFEKEAFGPGQVRRIIHALAGSSWFSTFRESVCSTWRFGRYLRHGTWSWGALAAKTKVLIFPCREWEVDQVEETLTKLLPGNANSVITLEPCAELVAHHAEVNWTGSDLDGFCKAISPAQCEADAGSRALLRAFLADSRVARGASEQWTTLPIFEVRCLGGSNVQVMSSAEIEDKVHAGVLFQHCERSLEESFADACPDARIWLLVGDGPLGLNVPDLAAQRAADLVLRQGVLGIAPSRMGLVKLLSAPEVIGTCVRSIRYLLHGFFQHRAETEVPLLFRGGKWEEPVAALATALGRSWSWVSEAFQAELNSHQASQLGVRVCDAALFRDLCRSAMSDELFPNVRLHPYHDFLFTELTGDESDVDLLARLPIHRVGEEDYRPVSDGLWLAPASESIQYNVPLWQELKAQAQIVDRHDNPMVLPRQEAVFRDRVLDRYGIIRLAADQDAPTAFAPLILECLSQGTPSKEAGLALSQSEWLPLQTGGGCLMDQVLWVEGCEAELEAVVRRLPTESNLYSRSQLAIEWDGDSEGRRWVAQGWSTLANPRSPLVPVERRLVDALRTPVEQSPALHVGIALSTPEEMRTWLEAISGIERDICPVVGLIRYLLDPARLQRGKESSR